MPPRIKVTHTGSLPRTPDLGALIDARERGEDVAPDRFRRAAEAAVERVVAKQLEAGIDIGSDGEQPRVNYATYAADRMRGFGGESLRAPLTDFVDYPGVRRPLRRPVHVGRRHVPPAGGDR
jgi:5-methyltetrahydropteroyltriglutamate--homocysteine methyltransferase